MAVKVKLRKKKTQKQRSQQQAPTKKEVSALGRAIRSLGVAAGSAAGSYVGNPMAGGALGHSLGAALSRWIGAGDYTVASNTIVQRSQRAAASIPVMHNEGQSVVIRHREYLGEVLSSIGFTVQQSFPLNPGLPTTFPWLSNIAASFQEYKIKGLVFHYIPTSGASVSSSNPALGSVMLQTSYRSTDSLPATKVELLNEFWANEVVPADSMAHPVECDPKENPFNVQYVRTGAVPTGDTQLMYDLGVTHLAVSGCQTNSNILGDLWVTYDIELKKPLLQSNATARVDSTQYTASPAPTTTTNMFGSTAITTTGLPCTLIGNTVTFPKGTIGTFWITFGVHGSGITDAWGGSPTLGNCSAANYGPSGSFIINGNTYASTTTDAIVVIGVTITNPTVQASVNFANRTATGTPTYSYCFFEVTQIA